MFLIKEDTKLRKQKSKIKENIRKTAILFLGTLKKYLSNMRVFESLLACIIFATLDKI